MKDFVKGAIVGCAGSVVGVVLVSILLSASTASAVHSSDTAALLDEMRKQTVALRDIARALQK